MTVDIYQTLGIDNDADIRQIRQAYAKLIKQFRPDTHPIEFGNIRQAYEIAIDRYKNYLLTSEQDTDSQIDSEQSGHQQNPGLPASSLLEEQPLPKTQLPVFDYLMQLSQLAERSDEQTAKEITQAFLGQLNLYSLDECSEIELEILNWIFTFRHPLLLTFIELDIYYKWTETLTFSMREFRPNEAAWLNDFRQLANDYQKALIQKNKNLSEVKSHLPTFLLSESDVLEKKQWQWRCDELNLPALKNYFKSPPGSKFPITREDIFFSMFPAVVVLLLGSASRLNIISVVASFVVFFLTLAIRAFVMPVLKLLVKSNEIIYQFRYLIYIFVIAILFQGGEYVLNEVADRSALQQEVIRDESPVVCNGIEKRESPIYPSDSRRLGEEGRVEVKFLVDINGAVISAEIHKSSGFERLDKESLKVVKRWCFTPPVKESYAVVPFSYHLDNESGKMAF